jgi:hypothetical protein
MSIRTLFNKEGSRASLLAAFCIALLATSAFAQEDGDADMAQYRERFKQGLDRYEANDVAGALSFWEPLYRDLGPTRGYRVGYNLARAYEVFGDATRAAERYKSFLDEVKARRKDGKTIDDLAASDEAKANARLDELTRTRGRIHVAPTSPPESVRIDQSEPRLAGFVAYVAPGAHDVVFAPGGPAQHVEHVSVQAGQLALVALPEKRVDIATPAFHETTHHPFSPTVLWIAGIATVLGGGGVTGGAYANALVLHDHYASQPTGVLSNAQITDYDNARTFAYASWAVPAALVVTTAILLVWYASGSKHVREPGLAFAF